MEANNICISLGKISICLFILICCSCSSSINNAKDYYKYLNNEDNGLIKTKKIGPISFSMKYLPTDFFLCKKGEGKSKRDQDSIRTIYEPSLNFILKIAPSDDTESEFDVITGTVNSEEEFKQRAFSVNFELQKFISLKIGDKRFKPVIVEMENVYGLTKHRLVNIVFAKEDFEKDWSNVNTIDLVFNDEIYGTGMHHFVFNKDAMNDIPPLSI